MLIFKFKLQNPSFSLAIDTGFKPKLGLKIVVSQYTLLEVHFLIMFESFI